MSNEKKPAKQWIVYKLVNRTLREIYFGISQRSMHSLKDHRKANIPCTEHWDFMRDDIEHHVVYTKLNKSTAIEKAEELGKGPHLKRFEVINLFSLHN